MHPLVGRAISEDRQARYRFVTVEQLLLALLEDASAVQVLRSWGCDVEGLQKALVDFMSRKPALPKDSATRTQPAAGFVRVIEHATIRAIVREIAGPVMAGQPRQAGVSDLLEAILDRESGSPAVIFFRRHTQTLNPLGRAESPRAGGPA
jgi:ATP-dependent Clp protease ATP-binding subunit ClpA